MPQGLDSNQSYYSFIDNNTIPLVFGVGVAKKVALTFLVIYLCIECYLNLEVFALNFIISASLCFLYSFFIY